MKIQMARDVLSPDTFTIRISELAMERMLPAKIADEMSAAIDKFVREDGEVQILINEMVKKAFAEINLLDVVTKAVKAKVQGDLENEDENRTTA